MAQSIGQIGQKLDLNIRQGADFGPYTITVQNPDTSIVDLTGTTARAQIRKTFDSPDPPIASFDIAIDGAAGKIDLSLGDTITAAFVVGANTTSPESLYVWDLAITWVDGKVQALLYGDIRVLRRITR